MHTVSHGKCFGGNISSTGSVLTVTASIGKTDKRMVSTCVCVRVLNITNTSSTGRHNTLTQGARHESERRRTQGRGRRWTRHAERTARRRAESRTRGASDEHERRGAERRQTASRTTRRRGVKTRSSGRTGRAPGATGRRRQRGAGGGRVWWGRHSKTCCLRNQRLEISR